MQAFTEKLLQVVLLFLLSSFLSPTSST